MPPLRPLQPMRDRVQTLDLHFQEHRQTIASYLLPHKNGAALIETGPGSTFPMLQAQLADYGLTPADISDVLLTHIHLDHAGAAGHLAQHGPTIYVHELGAPHLADPTTLWRSASRIYGEDMEDLWGDMRPVPEHQIVALKDGNTIAVAGTQVHSLDTPGHASHHMSYVIGDVCFSGDVGGVRLPGESYVELPLAPPEIHLDRWRESLARLRQTVDQRDVTCIAPTHFGLYDDVASHLDRLEDSIEATEDWVEHVLPNEIDDEDGFRHAVRTWMRGLAATRNVEDKTWQLYELANPSWMAALGLKRYWEKHKAPSA